MLFNLNYLTGIAIINYTKVLKESVKRVHQLAGYGNGFAIGEFTGQWSANRRIAVRALKSQIMLSLSGSAQKETIEF